MSASARVRTELMPTAAEIQADFAAEISSAGLAPHDGKTIPADGVLHRYRLHDDKPGRRNGSTGSSVPGPRS